MRLVTIWCYECGTLWFNMSVEALYGDFAKCPQLVHATNASKVRCGGYTDGVEA